MLNQPISVIDALAYLRAIQHQSVALSFALEHFALNAPEPLRSLLITWSGTAEAIADKASAAEAALNP